MRGGVLTGATLVCLAPAAAIADWQNTRWGMTEAEVAAVVPGAVPTTGEDRSENFGTIQTLKAPYEAAGIPLVAYFSFDKAGKLAVVILETRVVEDGPRLMELLDRQYGQPIDHQSRPSSGCTSISSSWRDEERRNTVGISGFWCADNGITNVVYRPFATAAETGL